LKILPDYVKEKLKKIKFWVSKIRLSIE